MTQFASVALFRRKGELAFRPARKEASAETTQARKSAARFWNGAISEPDKLTKIVVVSKLDRLINISERATSDRDWISYSLDPLTAAAQPHLAACLVELGIDPEKAPPPLPDMLEINGAIYRREI